VTTAVQALFNSFDALSEDERHEVVVELLRRVAPTDELSDEALVAAADEVFRELDAREAADAGPEAR
jgi:predicted HAD superfamily phosphohydrolase